MAVVNLLVVLMSYTRGRFGIPLNKTGRIPGFLWGVGVGWGRRIFSKRIYAQGLLTLGKIASDHR